MMMTSEGREFRAPKSAIMNAYYDFITQSPEPKGGQLTKQMKEFIQQDPDFLDPYNIMYHHLRDRYHAEKALDYLNQAYERALKQLLDDEGHWPARLDWEWMENRAIIRTLWNRADALYAHAFRQEALDLFRRIIRYDQRDANGVRFKILALRMGKSYKDYYIDFELMDPSGRNLHSWFDRNAKKFPEEWQGLDCYV